MRVPEAQIHTVLHCGRVDHLMRNRGGNRIAADCKPRVTGMTACEWRMTTRFRLLLDAGDGSNGFLLKLHQEQIDEVIELPASDQFPEDGDDLENDCRPGSRDRRCRSVARRVENVLEVPP